MICAKEIPSQLLLPVSLISFAFAGFLAFQTTLLISDRAAINTAYVEQTKTLEQVEKVRGQASALVKGVVDLDKKGNKNARFIIEELKKVGINFQDDAAQVGAAPASADVPAPATEEEPKR
ncbi:MAG: hypothetical protein WC521_01245 [Bdellovibrionales bacterium]|jgi:hypothetical protein